MITALKHVLGENHRKEVNTYLAWLVAAAVLEGLAVAVLVPLLTAVLRDDLDTAARWLAVLAAASVISSIVYYIQGMRGFGTALTVLDTLHGRIGDHVARMPLGWFAGESVGRLSRISTQGVHSIVGSIAHLVQPLVRGVVTPVTIAVVVCFYDWRLGLVALLASPLIFLCFRFSARLLGRSDELADEAAVTSANRVLEFARHQPVLRAFGQSTSGYAPLEEAIENQRRVGRMQMNWTVGGSLLSGVTIQATFTVMVLVVVLLAGNANALELVALLALLARFIGPLALVSELSGGVRMARNDLGRAQAVLDVPPLSEPARPAVFDSAQTGAISFTDVRFGYSPEAEVLRGVTFAVKPGSVTALVGRSGSGKTTITRLAARFHDVTGGTVRIGGVDVREQTTAQLMGQLSLVFQDVYLFDGTIAENVRLGRASATDAELDEAAVLSGVDEIVERLPAGWETRVGEGGAALSGGERQRVSIARALLKRAPIVLLDEATAALDASNEALVRRSLRALSRHGTVLVIAHTPAMITSAEKILVLEEGTIAGSGTHAELLESHAGYARMFAERAATAGWQLRS